MRIIFYLLTFLMLSTVSLANHADKLVEEGEELYRSKKYIEAIKILNEAIADKSLHQYSIPKAYYYRGSVRMALGVNEKATEKEPYLMAYYDFRKAQQEDRAKKGWIGVSAEKLSELTPYLIKRALFLYKNSAKKNKVSATLSKTYFEALADISPSVYVYEDYIGQCYLLLNDTTEAVKSFEKAQTLAIETKDGKVDVTFGYSFYRLAKLYGIDLADRKKGIDVLTKAKYYLKRESKELEKSRLTTTVDEYKQLKNDVEGLMVLYDKLALEFPSEGGDDKRKIATYEQILSKNSKDIGALIAYATLIEKDDAKKAEELYKRVIAIDVNNFSAYYGIGALYVEQGGVFLYWAHEAKTNEEIEKYNTLGKEKYKASIPYFVKAYELNPKEEVLRQTILQLSKAVGDEETYQKYAQ